MSVFRFPRPEGIQIRVRRMEAEQKPLNHRRLFVERRFKGFHEHLFRRQSQVVLRNLSEWALT